VTDEPVCAQKGPYQVTLEAGRAYLWCRCGRSQRQPFCDTASHKGTGLLPHRFVAEEGGMVNLCGCKSTDDPPFCDGMHNML
jgi:CDGSH-type Zn-finger protein